MQKAIRESAYLDEYLCDNHTLQLAIREVINTKKCFHSGIARKREGGGPMPELFALFSPSSIP